ncbi:MAG: ferredoxin family protein [Coriobacteriaceae bacterium]|jgi:ferredoxin-like protein FixX|nr:ferredoxin family protein [Coriobacteriaceae bacterium]
MTTEAKVNVEEKLACNKYNVDEGHAHIALKEEGADNLFDQLILCCPAALYRRGENGARSFDYAGCLECGTCRVLCGDTLLERWEYPQSSMGVSYRFG